MVRRGLGRKSPRWLERHTGKDRMGVVREGGHHDTLADHGRAWPWQCVLALLRGGGDGVWREESEEEGERARRGLSLEETFPRPFWSPCGARPVPF